MELTQRSKKRLIARAHGDLQTNVIGGRPPMRQEVKRGDLRAIKEINYTINKEVKEHDCMISGRGRSRTT